MAIKDVVSKNYSEMGSGSRMMLFLGMGLIVILFVGLLVLVFNKQYEVLFSDLESHDASTIISELESNKIEYKLENNGRTILVQEQDVHKTRLNVVNSVPALSGGVGFEIFDKDDFGTTEFAQKINYQRALQGELARTIMALNEVKFARVHLVLPDSSIFKRKNNESRASVTLMVRAGQSLDQDQVTGIQKLVASSTPGLKPSNVTILDQKGVTLIAQESDEYNTTMASKKLHRKQEIESYLTKKAQTVLDQAFGAARAHVTIDVALDFNNIKKTRQQVIPPNDDGSNIYHKKEVRMKGNKKQQSDTSRSTVEIDYELSKEVEEIVSTPGSINRMSIAIVLPEGLSAEQHNYIRMIVGNAVGYDRDRGDLIALSSVMEQSFAAKPEQTTPMTPVAGTTVETTSMAEQYDNQYLSWAATKTGYLVTFATKNPVMTFFAIAGLLMLLILMLLILMFRPKAPAASKSSVNISEEERHQLLSDIKNWLAAEGK